MSRATLVFMFLLCATAARAEDVTEHLGQAVSLFESKCPFIREHFEQADEEFRRGSWKPAGNWGKTAIGRYGGWRNEEDTITVSFQNYQFVDSKFWQCRVSVLAANLDVDPLIFFKGEEVIDGAVETSSDGGFAGMWKVKGDLFTSVNALYDGKILSLVKMTISNEVVELSTK